MSSRCTLSRIRGSWLFMMLVLAGFSVMKAQSDEKVILNHADSLVGLELRGEPARQLIGNVRFTQQKVVVRCDRAIQFLRSDRVDFEGNVFVTQDSLTMTARRGSYYPEERAIEAFDDVHLDDGKTTLTSEYGKYYSSQKRAFFKTRVVVRDSTTLMTSDSLTYFRDDKRTTAAGRVSIYSSSNKITLLGEHFENYRNQNYSLMTIRPMAVEIDTGSDGIVDTMVVTSRVMESYQDTLPRLIATDSVTLTRGELTAKGGLAVFFTKADSIVFRKSPVVWYTHSAWETTQVTGDSMFVKLEKRRVERLHVRGRSFAASCADSLLKHRYHQMSGQIITMHFVNNALDHTEVDKTATVLYYLFDGKKPNGANKTTGDHVSILFHQKKVNSIRVKGGVEGQYFPEKMVKNKEENYNLPGFHWQQQYRRPYLSLPSSGLPSPMN